MRQVVLCADDFAVTEGVSRAILDLARAGRLSATSAMTSRPWWPRLAPALRECDGRLGVGLHLNLTLGAPLGAMPRLAPNGALPSLSTVMRTALLGRSPRGEIREEIERQLAAFEAAMGRPPDFVDGHQHVHVLPGIRAELLAALGSRGWRGVWLRDPSDRLRAILKRRVAVRKALTVRALATGFAQAARAAGFSVNEGFSGFNPFDPAGDVAAEFARAFDALGPRPVVMCHPGHVDAELAALDPVVASREREYAYLASEAFGELLRSRRVALVPRLP
ncbi:MAG TPA: ChbG/HpnK family deacetylase [Beijerinckiaceae bacterium]|nr:ChbG/HpnK family deacetylase [Beijerinckiaceae bacterium]